MTAAILVLATETAEVVSGKKNPGEQENLTVPSRAVIAETVLPEKAGAITALTEPQETGRDIIIQEKLMITTAGLREIRAVIRQTGTGHQEMETEPQGTETEPHETETIRNETETGLPDMETEAPETETDLNQEAITGIPGKNQNSGTTDPMRLLRNSSSQKRLLKPIISPLKGSLTRLVK
jgi:hypothetical protein